MFVTELIEYLRAEGVGTPGASVNGLFYSSRAVLPTGVGPFIVIRETGGAFEERTHNAVLLPAYVRPGAQIVTHGGSYNAALGLAQQTRYTLGRVRNQTLGATSLSVTGITRVGNVATVTTTADHKYVQGMTIRISGAVEGAYNGDVVISGVTARTFTYGVAGSPATPATGTATAAFLGTWYREIGIEQEPFDLGVENDRARVVFNIVAVKRPS